MRITSPPEATLARHSVAFHDSESELMEQLVPVVTAAVDAGEALALALRPTTETALRAAVECPSDVLVLARPDGPDGPSGQTLAARWARELRELTTSGRQPINVITEHWSAFDGADGGFWTELDAAANIALSALPVSMTCFYPAYPLHGSVVEGALRNHRTLLRHGLLSANDAYLPPTEVLLATPAPAPLVLGPPDERRTFGAWALNDVRDSVETAMLAAGFGRDRAEDVVLAVNEIATNAVEHGPRRGRAVRVDRRRRLRGRGARRRGPAQPAARAGRPAPGRAPRARRLDRPPAVRLAARLVRWRRDPRASARGPMTSITPAQDHRSQ